MTSESSSVPAVKNGSFSSAIPGLQIFWDSTSMKAFKSCPRKYQYEHVLGLQPLGDTNDHITFGLVYHAALERYDHLRFDGMAHEDAVADVVQYALVETWNKTLGRGWTSELPNKNRLTLVRSIVWYLEEFVDDPVRTVRLASSGQPAVELSFQYQTNFSNSAGEFYSLCGHLDRIGEFQDQIFIADRKTTAYGLDENYFSQFTPDLQMTNYAAAGKVVFGLPIAGIILDAVQVGVSFSRYMRSFIPRSPGDLEEFYSEFKQMTEIAQYYAKQQFWPKNETACFRCHWRPLCSKSPEVRERWLKAMTRQRVWDPTIPRGNI